MSLLLLLPGAGGATVTPTPAAGNVSGPVHYGVPRLIGPRDFFEAEELILKIEDEADLAVLLSLLL